MLSLLLLISSSEAASTQKGCAAVTRDRCGVDWSNSCLKCGSASAFDCEECCAGCTQVVKGTYKYCDCKMPPGPSPSPHDTWNHYEIAGLDVISVTGGLNHTSHEAVVIMLHGGGGSGRDWEYQYDAHWFGNLTGLKYVFPTSHFPSHVWFTTYKNGCGLSDDCAYNTSSIQESASRVAALVRHEAGLLGGDHSKVFLAGFSEGAQLAGYVQLAMLDVALGGTIVMDGFPLPPLFDWHDGSAASYAGRDMSWMIWHGEADPIFPCQLTLSAWEHVFDALGVRDAVLQVEHAEPGMTHTLIKPELERMVRFVRARVHASSGRGQVPSLAE